MKTILAFSRRSMIGGAAAIAATGLVEASVPTKAAQDATPMATPVASNDLPLVQVGILTGSDPAAFNQTGRDYEVDGTDLGSSFLYRDHIFLVFGDTFGVAKSDWRSNVLAISQDDDPGDGVTIERMIEDRPGHAKEILSSRKIDFDEMTVIPTYGVAVGDRLFLHYMSVSHWGDPGKWELGSAGWAFSDDDGETWKKDPAAVFPPDTNWGQVAIEEQDGYLYLFGIPGGRYGDLKLARVAPADLLEIATYTYWDGSTWVGDPERAAVVVAGPVGELSVRWNSYYKRWLMMYLIDNEGLIVLRTAENITGPWDEARVVVRSTDYPALYAPYMYPKWNDGPDIHFNMSMFGPYNVYVMRTSIPDLFPLSRNSWWGQRHRDVARHATSFRSWPCD